MGFFIYSDMIFDLQRNRSIFVVNLKNNWMGAKKNF